MGYEDHSHIIELPQLHIQLTDQKLRYIIGNPPDLISPPSGCRFNPRCPYHMKKCREKEPPTIQIGSERMVKCFRYENGEGDEVDTQSG